MLILLKLLIVINVNLYVIGYGISYWCYFMSKCGQWPQYYMLLEWVLTHAYSFKKNIFDIKFCHMACKKWHETRQIINNILQAFTLFCYTLQLAMSQLAASSFCCQIMFGGILDFPPFYTSHLQFSIFIPCLIFGRVLSLKIFL